MNERIQQMIHSLNEKVGIHWINEDKIKFADLIVQECAQYIEYQLQVGGYKADMLKRHFGVEE